MKERIHPIRSFLQVTRHELTDSVRSRRAIVLMILYFMGAVAATLIFVKILHHVENQVERAVGVSQSRHAGGTTDTLWKSDPFYRVLVGLLDDKDLARSLVNTPPVAVFYGWLAFSFAPLLVMLLSSARISQEVWSGSVRFVLFRCSRLTWCLGKFFGQACQLWVALLLGAVGVWLVGFFKLTSFEAVPTAWVLLGFSMRAWIYTLAFLGLATGVSQVITGPNLASAGGIFGLIVLAILGAVSSHYAGPGIAQLWDLVNQLTPAGHRLDMWRPDAVHLVRGSLFVVSLGFAYMLIGHAIFARRDL